MASVGRRVQLWIWKRWPNKTIRLSGGIRIPVNATEALWSVRTSWLRRSYEPDELDSVQRYLRPDDRVLELGSGCGVITAAAAKITTKGTVLAYEPNDALGPSITAVLAANGVAAEVRHAMVARRDGTSTFFIATDFRGSSSFSAGGGGAPAAREVQVQVHAFDRIAAEFRPTALLLDVQGTEYELLGASAPDLPMSVRLVGVELHPHIIGEAAAEEIVANLKRQAFIDQAPDMAGNVRTFCRPPDQRLT